MIKKKITKQTNIGIGYLMAIILQLTSCLCDAYFIYFRSFSNVTQMAEIFGHDSKVPIG